MNDKAVDREITGKGSDCSTEEPAHTTGSAQRSFARELRALGQALEKFGFSVFDLEIENGIYFVTAKTGATPAMKFHFLRWVRRFFSRSFCSLGGTRSDRRVDLRFTREEIDQFDERGKNRRQDSGKATDPYTISQLLRGAGCYLDNRNVLDRVEISLAGKSIAMRYLTVDRQTAHAEHRLEYFYDYWVKMYLRRKNRVRLPPARKPTLAIPWQEAHHS